MKFLVEFRDQVYYQDNLNKASPCHRHIFRIFKEGLDQEILVKILELNVMTETEEYFDVEWITWLYFLRKHNLLYTIPV